MRKTVGLLILAVLVLSAGWGVDYEELAAQRDRYAQKREGDIVIVAIEEPEKTAYVDGIKLAVQQVNERPDKLLGRTLQLQVKKGGATFDEEKAMIHQNAANPRVTAVLGHRRSSVAVPASVIYESSQVLFLPPFAAVKGLTGHGFNFLFRMTPSIKGMSEQLASAAELLGYKNIVLLYSQDDYSRELAFLFEDAALARKVKFVHRHSFSAKDLDYRPLITLFRNESFDAVFLATSTEPGARMARQLRETGIHVPILGGDGLNTGRFDQAAGAAGNNTIIPVVYRADNQYDASLRFQADYEQVYGTKPDYNAAQGYDSALLLVHVIEQAKSTTPGLLASTLHYIPYWVGVTGVHGFDEQGDVQGKKYFFQVLRNEQWHVLPVIQQPYFLEKFERPLLAQRRQLQLDPLTRIFSTKLHPDDLKAAQLDFLHELLRFHRLGLIYAEPKDGRPPAYHERIEALAEKKGFTVTKCGIPFASLKKAESERRLVECYGKLSLLTDALCISRYPGIDKAFIEQLHKPLEQYRLPVFALQDDADPSAAMTMTIGKAGVNLRSHQYATLFSGILRGVKIHELSDRLENLPILSVNLRLLDAYGYLRSSRVLPLAPDVFL